MSVETLRNELTESLVNFIWRQWCGLGVPGTSEAKTPWVIDPEVLVAMTTEIGRYDARLFDGMLDWLVVNGSWINVQRLSTLMRGDRIGSRVVAGAVAAWMCEHDKSAKWQRLAKRGLEASCQPPEPLFRSASGGSIEPPDPRFKSYGLLREAVQRRGLTQEVNMKDPVNAMLKSRALFGIGIRADVMTYLMATEGGHARLIAALLGFNQMRVQEVLTGLADAAFVSVRPVGKAKQYWLDKDRWGPIWQAGSNMKWLNWRDFACGLTTLWREMLKLDEKRADAFIASSKMREAMRMARNDLQASGADFRIQDDRGHIAEAYLPVFENDLRGILAKLRTS